MENNEVDDEVRIVDEDVENDALPAAAPPLQPVSQQKELAADLKVNGSVQRGGSGMEGWAKFSEPGHIDAGPPPGPEAPAYTTFNYWRVAVSPADVPDNL